MKKLALYCGLAALAGAAFFLGTVRAGVPAFVGLLVIGVLLA